MDRRERGVEDAIAVFDGRWKLEIIFCLFGGKVLRFSDLERAIPGVSQKMLTQQLRRLEKDGVVERIVYAQTPPKVEYKLTPWANPSAPRSTRCSNGWTHVRPS